MVLRGRVTDRMIQGSKESIIAGMSCSENQAAVLRRSSLPERSSEPCVELDFLDHEKCIGDKEHTTEEEAEPVVGRSNREKKVPDYYGDWASVTNAEPLIKDALSSPDKGNWMSAKEKEIESL